MKRLGEFYDMLATLKEIVVILKDLFHDADGNVLSSLSSTRLRQLVGFKRVVNNPTVNAEMVMQNNNDDENDNNEMGEGIFPDYSPILDEFESMIVWKGYVPKPRKGIFEEFDRVDETFTKIRNKIDDYVEEVKIETRCP